MSAEASLQNIKLPTPGTFNGKSPNDYHIFEAFSKKLKAFLMSQDIQFKRLMTAAETSTTPVGIPTADADIKKSHELQALLTLLCTDDALRLVSRDDDIDENGFESWRRLFQRYAPQKRLQHFGQMQQILAWQFREGSLEQDLIDYNLEIQSYLKLAR